MGKCLKARTRLLDIDKAIFYKHYIEIENDKASSLMKIKNLKNNPNMCLRSAIFSGLNKALYY